MDSRRRRARAGLAYFGRGQTISLTCLGQWERWEPDTRIGSLGQAQFAASRHRLCGAQLLCRLAGKLRGRLDFGNRPYADILGAT